MKIRSGFVANSSSSSFIVLSLGEKEILEANGDETGYAYMFVDDLIEKLQKAQSNGITKLEIEFGGGYDG